MKVLEFISVNLKSMFGFLAPDFTVMNNSEMSFFALCCVFF